MNTSNMGKDQKRNRFTTADCQCEADLFRILESDQPFRYERVGYGYDKTPAMSMLKGVLEPGESLQVFGVLSLICKNSIPTLGLIAANRERRPKVTTPEQVTFIIGYNRDAVAMVSHALDILIEYGIITVLSTGEYWITSMVSSILVKELRHLDPKTEKKLDDNAESQARGRAKKRAEKEAEQSRRDSQALAEAALKRMIEGVDLTPEGGDYEI